MLLFLTKKMKKIESLDNIGHSQCDISPLYVRTSFSTAARSISSKNAIPGPAIAGVLKRASLDVTESSIDIVTAESVFCKPDIRKINVKLQ